MLTEPIRKANARRLQEETNGLIKELFMPLYYKKGGVPNVCQNQKEVDSNHEGKTAHFVLEVKGSNGGQMCTL